MVPSLVAWSAFRVNVVATGLASVTAPVMLMSLPTTSAVVTLLYRFVVAAVTARLARRPRFQLPAPKVAVDVPAWTVRLRGVASESTVATPAAVNATAPPAPVDVPVPPPVRIVTFAPQCRRIVERDRSTGSASRANSSAALHRDVTAERDPGGAVGGVEAHRPSGSPAPATALLPDVLMSPATSM